MTMEWYVIHAYSGYENKVREALMERIERFSMEDNFSEILIPSEEVVELRGAVSYTHLTLPTISSV